MSWYAYVSLKYGLSEVSHVEVLEGSIHGAILIFHIAAQLQGPRTELLTYKYEE